jgi:hypothetical protein
MMRRGRRIDRQRRNQEFPMFPSHPPAFLRFALLADALVSGATGLAMFAGAGLVDALLGLPAPLLRYAGLVLLPYAAAVGWIGLREDRPRAAVWAVVAVNALWAAGSIALLTGGWVSPTLLGHAFVIFQAVVVALFAELQYVGLRRTAMATA